MSASAQGISSAAPRPWAVRAAISRAAFEAKPAAEGGHSEDGDSDREDLAPAEPIARSTPGQQQSGQAQGIGVDDPLHRRQRGREILLHRRQRHIDDGFIDIGHGRAEDGRRQDPGLLALGELDRPATERASNCSQGRALGLIIGADLASVTEAGRWPASLSRIYITQR